MSKRREINTLKTLTGLKYSYIRKRYKANKYDFWLTFKELQFDSAYRFERLSKCIHEDLQASLNALSGSVADFIKSTEELKKSVVKGENENA